MIHTVILLLINSLVAGILIGQTSMSASKIKTSTLVLIIFNLIFAIGGVVEILKVLKS